MIRPSNLVLGQKMIKYAVSHLKKAQKILIVTYIIVVAITLNILLLLHEVLFNFISKSLFNHENKSSLSEIGDSFGVINSIFSICAFLALAYATWLQDQALKDARENLHQQNKNLIKSLEMLKESSDAQKRIGYGTTYNHIVSRLESEHQRQLRGKLYTLYETKKYEFWTEADKEIAYMLAANWDICGMLAKSTDLPVRYLAEHYSRAIIGCWICAEEAITDRRDHRQDPVLWQEFSDLYEIARLHRISQNLPNIKFNFNH